jgi:Lsr2
MAQKIQTFLIDDLDGSEAEDTVFFGLDGVHYEIDLSTDHAKDLRTALARYTDAARKVTGTARRTAHNGRKAPPATISSTDVRAWAKAHGVELKERGRIPAGVLAQYQAATGS